MKIIHWSGLAVLLAAAVTAEARLTSAAADNPYLSFTSLTDMNQSQNLEAISTADRTGLPSYKTASVHFIVDAVKGQLFDSADTKNEFSDPTENDCKRLGFSVTSCASGLFNKFCPYNDKIYDKCCESTYHFAASQCSAPRQLSSDTCGGKYSCLCSTSAYPFASCNDPQIKGDSCTDEKGTRYTTCVCPNPVSTPYGCETYYAAPCGSVCKKAYADNCRNRTAVQTPYGCEKYFADCSSKCEKAYSDNCRNRTAVIASCPANATCSYFGDCKSKIQSWSCNSGYEKSGNSCILGCSCPYGTWSNCWHSQYPYAVPYDDDGCGNTCYKCYNGIHYIRLEYDDKPTSFSEVPPIDYNDAYLQGWGCRIMGTKYTYCEKDGIQTFVGQKRVGIVYASCTQLEDSSYLGKISEYYNEDSPCGESLGN